jgi:hypothetical protein
MLLLFGGRCAGEGDFEDSEQTFIADCQQSLFSGFVDLDDFLLSDVENLMQPGDLAADDLGNPKSAVHESFSGLDGDGGGVLAEEEGECAGDVLAWVSAGVP